MADSGYGVAWDSGRHSLTVSSYVVYSDDALPIDRGDRAECSCGEQFGTRLRGLAHVQTHRRER